MVRERRGPVEAEAAVGTGRNRLEGILEVELGGERRELAQCCEPRERLSLELAHALAGQIELVTDRLERPRLALEPEAQLENPPLPLGQRIEARRTPWRRSDSSASSNGSAASRSAKRSPSSPSSSAPTVWFSDTDACAAPSASSTC